MYRIGLGCDQHRYKPGSMLLLGGVEIKSEYGIEAYSDGDVLLHALTDALLGAVAGGDIGELFPDSAVENRSRCSVDFIERACEIVVDKGYVPVNVDIVIQAEKPRLSGYKTVIAESVSRILRLDTEFVSVKAKTAEGMDAVGRCEGIRVDTVVLVRRKECAE